MFVSASENYISFSKSVWSTFVTATGLDSFHNVVIDESMDFSNLEDSEMAAI